MIKIMHEMTLEEKEQNLNKILKDSLKEEFKLEDDIRKIAKDVDNRNKTIQKVVMKGSSRSTVFGMLNKNPVNDYIKSKYDKK